MARIRTIKPDFWEDERVATLSPRARLLFIGSWNLADDEGLLRWTADYIGASLFMYDDLTVKQVQALMDEVVTAGMVFPYRGGTSQQRLAYIMNFAKHQRINRPSPPKLPPPSLMQPAVRAMYALRDEWTCYLCLRLIPEDSWDAGDDTLEIDHVTPRVAKGTDYPSNLRATHRACNRAKGGRTVSDSDTDSLSEPVSASLIDSQTGSPLEGKGREKEGRGGGRDARANTRPDPWCPKHPGGTDTPCRPCATARTRSETWTPPPRTVDDALTVETCRHGGEIGRCPSCRREASGAGT